MDVIAQGGGDLQGMLQIFGPLGVAGMLAWYMWYTTSVSGPKKDEIFANEQRLARVEYMASLDRMTDNFRQECRAIREHCENHREKA